MTEPTGFPPDVLDGLRTTDEVRIETRAAQSAPAHRTTIWVVVDDRDRVLIRTYLGPSSRWYREARANPECMLWLGGEPVAVRAEPANDPDRLAAASREYEAKYAGDPAVRGMVAEAQLPTTLELRPR
ncbi:MAG TPA: nitroreductase/quinone reductase family protein [Pleomorphomonadaceae bacterium]|nr:nitroreductase/quinone reductase family protein [Pleomorphomonadaceae bacterium]